MWSNWALNPNCFLLPLNLSSAASITTIDFPSSCLLFSSRWDARYALNRENTWSTKAGFDCSSCGEEFSMTSGAEWLKLRLPIDRLTTHSSPTTSMSAWKARVRWLNHTKQSLNTETPPIRNTQGTRPKRGVLQCPAENLFCKKLLNLLRSFQLSSSAKMY